MVLPVYGHKDSENQNPIAIFQLINKVDSKPITDYDFKKLEAISELLG